MKNLLIITADDLNGDSAGWMGSTVGATPNIDAFAENAHQFRNCHVVTPLCQPSRSALMTGLFPPRNGSLGFEPVRDDVRTLVEIVRGNGYFAAAINKKRHMMPPQKFPWDLSFDGSGKNPPLLREHFQKCFDAADATKKPFFINANCTDPHGPFPGNFVELAGKPNHRNEIMSPPPRIFDESEITVPSFLEDLPEVRSELACYFSAVARLDQSFGGLIAALQESGKIDNTVIVFLADHGMSMPFSKATLFRNATWSPVLLHLPKVDRRVVSDDIVSSIDILPTLLEVLDLPRPNDLDGRSLFSSDRARLDHVFTQLNALKNRKRYPSRCVRTKTRAYIWNAWSDGRTRFGSGTTESRASWKAMVEAAETDPRIKARVEHFIYRTREEFYDEEGDPDERCNLIDAPDYRSEIEQMKKLLRAHMEQTNDPLLAEFSRI